MFVRNSIFRIILLIILISLAAATLPASGKPSKGKFSNAAKKLGIDDVKAARSQWIDIDGDGWLDLIILRFRPSDPDKRDQPRVFLNMGKGRAFREMTKKSGILLNRRKSKNGRICTLILAGDVNNDGKADLFSGAYCEFEKPKQKKGTNQPEKDENGNTVMTQEDHGDRNEILISSGKGYFTLTQKQSELSKSPATLDAATFLDYDRDGCLDLFVGNWYRKYGWTYECYEDRLYRGDGKGGFQDVTEKAGISLMAQHGQRNSRRPVYGAASVDINNDGWTDILVASYGRQWNLCWLNQGDGTFKEIAAQNRFDGDEDESGKHDPRARRRNEQPFRSNGNTFGIAPGDVDNDGDMDIFLAEITHWWAMPASDLSCVLENLGPEKNHEFKHRPDAIPRKHTTQSWNQGDMHAAWFDYDHDTDLDLLLASSDYPDEQRLRIFRQDSPFKFTDVSLDVGINWLSATGISLGDYDRDGDLDIVCGNTHTRLTKEQRKAMPLGLAVWQNNAADGNWITVELRGKGKGHSNGLGIGARITCEIVGVTMIREISGGSGHVGQQDAIMAHFGLGSAKKIKKLTVRWPDKKGTETTYENLDANHHYMITEGEKDPKKAAAGKTFEK
ncbi:MAG: CRTAC1 family protein [Planctomycetota bacterium]|jgi:hypothetical protein